jgi:NAD(P)-dependent dehydrogenase (short-subunit alcohol dehydrogenase family)
LVTGGAKGIGRYVAHTFARAGASVAVADIAPPNKTVAELGEMGTQALAVTADVRSDGDVRAMVDQVVSRFGRIDVLVNNAAIVPHFSWGVPTWPRFAEMDQSFWEGVIGTNLGGTFLCTRHVLPHMEAQRSGHVLNVYGGGGLGSTGGAYVISKEAIRVFTQFAAAEVRDSNVCVVTVYPGAAIATEEAPEDARQRMPGTESVGERFVLAAQLGMDMSGKMVDLVDGRLEVLAPRDYS